MKDDKLRIVSCHDKPPPGVLNNPVARLRAAVATWHAVAANANKEFPCHDAAYVSDVTYAFAFWLEETGGGLIRLYDTWWLWRGTAGSDGHWEEATRERVAQAFQEFWSRVSPMVCTSWRMAKLLRTMATLPYVVVAPAEPWDGMHNHHGRLATGWGYDLRDVARMDMLIRVGKS